MPTPYIPPNKNTLYVKPAGTNTGLCPGVFFVDERFCQDSAGDARRVVGGACCVFRPSTLKQVRLTSRACLANRLSELLSTVPLSLSQQYQQHRKRSPDGPIETAGRGAAEHGRVEADSDLAQQCRLHEDDQEGQKNTQS